MTTNVNPAGVVRETLIGPQPPHLAAGLVARETLYGIAPGPVRVAAVCRETLMPGFAIVRTCIFM